MQENALSSFRYIALGVGLTGIATLESWSKWPYAPFPVVYAVLALIIPYRFNERLQFKDLRISLRKHFRVTIFLAVAALIYMLCFIFVYHFILQSFHVLGDPNWNIVVTYTQFGHLYLNRYSEFTVLLVAYLFVGIWPMFGEELFYRGFLYGGLASRMPPLAAAGISCSLFGLRHALQLVYLLPGYPLGSGIAYFLWAAGFGALWTWAYHQTRSLWPCVVTHAANLLLAPVIFIILSHAA